jgi:hypothetical protein
MRVRTLAAALAAAGLVAGCGGSSSPSTSTTTATKATTAKTPTATAPKTVSTSSTPSTTGAPTFASDANCLKLAGVSASFAKALASTTGTKFNESAAAADFQKLADNAPSAIRADLETVAGAFDKFAAAFKSSGYAIGKTPTPAQTAALESAVSVFTSPKVKAADAALQAWSVKNCS